MFPDCPHIGGLGLNLNKQRGNKSVMILFHVISYPKSDDHFILPGEILLVTVERYPRVESTGVGAKVIYDNFLPHFDCGITYTMGVS